MAEPHSWEHSVEMDADRNRPPIRNERISGRRTGFQDQLALSSDGDTAEVEGEEGLDYSRHVFDPVFDNRGGNDFYVGGTSFDLDPNLPQEVHFEIAPNMERSQSPDSNKAEAPSNPESMVSSMIVTDHQSERDNALLGIGKVHDDHSAFNESDDMPGKFEDGESDFEHVCACQCHYGKAGV